MFYFLKVKLNNILLLYTINTFILPVSPVSNHTQIINFLSLNWFELSIIEINSKE